MPYLYDRYTVGVPGDAGRTLQELGELAISLAEESARVYAIPCTWGAKRLVGDVGDSEVTFRVVRRRRKTPSPLKG